MLVTFLYRFLSTLAVKNGVLKSLKDFLKNNFIFFFPVFRPGGIAEPITDSNSRILVLGEPFFLVR